MLDASKNPYVTGALIIHCVRIGDRGGSWRGNRRCLTSARLRELSAKGDHLERVNALVDFEAFRLSPSRAVPRADRSRGGRPPYDHVLMFRVLILQASHSLSDERTEYLVKDRLSFMRFLAGAKGPRRALDGEILQGQVNSGRRNPDVRLQEPCRHRPAATG